jgi:excisionase family DNA binding protein
MKDTPRDDGWFLWVLWFWLLLLGIVECLFNPPTPLLDRLDTLDEKIDALRAERDPNRLLTREEAAERLRVSVRTLDTLRATGEIRAVKVKRRVRFHPEAVNAYMRRNAEGAER